MSASNEQIQALLAQLSSLATKSPVEAVVPAPVDHPPVVAAATVEEADDVPFDVPVVVEAPVVVAPMQATVVPPAPPKAKASKKQWASQKIPLPNGDTLEIRVAPKGYGTFGFVVGNEYVNFFGYRERMEGLASLFGPAFKGLILDWMVANGLKTRAEVFAS